MELLIFYIITIIVSYAIDISTVLSMTIYLYDEGYKLDFENAIKVADSNQNPNASKFLKLSKFVIGLNVGYSAYINAGVNSQKYKFIDILNVMGLLEHMTDEEIESYKKKRGFLGIVEVMSKNTKEYSDIDELREPMKILRDANQVIKNKNEKLENIYEKINQLQDERIKLLQLKKHQENIIQLNRISSELYDNLSKFKSKKIQLQELSKYLKQLQEKERKFDEQLSNFEIEVNKVLEKNIKS